MVIRSQGSSFSGTTSSTSANDRYAHQNLARPTSNNNTSSFDRRFGNSMSNSNTRQYGFSSPRRKTTKKQQGKISSPSPLSVYSRNTCHFVTPMMPSRIHHHHHHQQRSFSEKKQMVPMQSRAHLVHVRVLQKTAVLISGLPRNEFQNAKMIENEFRKFGVITNCLMNPKGVHFDKCHNAETTPSLVPRDNLNRNSNDGPATLGTVYVRFLNEKAATSAILATNGRVWKTNDNEQFRLRSCFVNNKYCDEFLRGKFCQDLNCILLHELVKEDLCQTANKNGTTNCGVKSFSHNQNYWKSRRGDHCNISNNAEDAHCQKYYYNDNNQFVRYSADQTVHCSNQYNVRVNGTPSARFRQPVQPTNVQTQVVTPQIPAKEFHKTPSYSDCRSVDILSATHSNIHILQRDRSSGAAGLPARQLFKPFMNNIIGPPTRQTEKIVHGIDNPWAIHSPITIACGGLDQMNNIQESRSHEINRPHHIVAPNYYTLSYSTEFYNCSANTDTFLQTRSGNCGLYSPLE